MFNVKRVELYSMLYSELGTYEDVLKKINFTIDFITNINFNMSNCSVKSILFEPTALQLQTALSILEVPIVNEKVTVSALIYYDKFVKAIQSNNNIFVCNSELIFYLSILKILKNDTEKLMLCGNIKSTEFPSIKLNYTPSKNDGFIL